MSGLSNREFKTELFEQFARVSQALSSGKRLEILELLAQGERSVDALTQLTGMTAANTSQHLQQLRKAGLVASRKDGLFVIYRIAGGGVVRLLMALREVAENNLAEVERLIKSFLSKKDNLEPVSADELRKLTRRGAVTVVDVRPPEEYAAGHLPGALNLPLPSWPSTCTSSLRIARSWPIAAARIACFRTTRSKCFAPKAARRGASPKATRSGRARDCQSIAVLRSPLAEALSAGLFDERADLGGRR